MPYLFNPFTGKLDYYTTEAAADILTKIKTVDGTGSGLDADLLDGVEGAGYSAAVHTHAYEPIDATIVRTGQANWIDLTDGGATTLHTHAGGGGDVIDSGIVVGQLTKGVTDSKHIVAAAIIPPATNILTITNAAASTLAMNVTAAKTLTLTSADDYNLTIPATGTAALLGTANVFTTQQMIDGTSDQIQQRIQANATQTTNLITHENSSANVLGGFQGRGTYYCDLNTVATNLFIGVNAGKSGATAQQTIAIGQSAGTALTSSISSTMLGYNAGLKLTSGNSNTLIGDSAGAALTTQAGNVLVGASAGTKVTAANNTMIGSGAGANTTTGTLNMFVGSSAGFTNIGGSNNAYIGSQAGYYATGSNNMFIGWGAGYNTSTGATNAFIGTLSGYNNQTGGGNIYIGYYAGYYQTASNQIIFDNQDRSTLAGDRTNAILYGVMAALPANQTLRVNAQLTTMGNRNAVTTQTAAYILTGTDQVCVCNSATAFSVTLPVASGSGQTYAIKNINTGAVTLTPNGTDTIDGTTTMVLAQWDAIQVVDYAANKWVVI